MKKLLLTLGIFTFVCTAPSFALKQIMNDETNRIVPSRLMGSYYKPSGNVLDETKTPNLSKSSQAGYMQTGVYVIPGYKAEEYERLYKPLLGKNIRAELAGTEWEYPDYEAIKIQYEREAAELKEREALMEQERQKLRFLKRQDREAADYFYRDTVNAPEKIIQSGYDIEAPGIAE